MQHIIQFEKDIFDKQVDHVCTLYQDMLRMEPDISRKIMNFVRRESGADSRPAGKAEADMQRMEQILSDIGFFISVMRFASDEFYQLEKDASELVRLM